MNYMMRACYSNVLSEFINVFPVRKAEKAMKKSNYDEALKELSEKVKNKKLITLRRCRCGIYFDIAMKHVHPTIPGPRTHEFNQKSNKFFASCEHCRCKQKEFRDSHKEHYAELKKQWSSKPENKERTKLRYQTAKYKEKKKEYNKEYLSRPEVKERIKEYNREYQSRPEYKMTRNEKERTRYHSDIVYRIRKNLSRALNKNLRNALNGKLDKNGVPYTKKTMEALGMTMEELMKRVEAGFTKDMNWDNYGRGPLSKEIRYDPETNKQYRVIRKHWQMDHNVPTQFDPDNVTVEKVIERSHGKNYQPLWSNENQSKGNRYVGKYRPKNKLKSDGATAVEAS